MFPHYPTKITKAQEGYMREEKSKVVVFPLSHEVERSTEESCKIREQRENEGLSYLAHSRKIRK